MPPEASGEFWKTPGYTPGNTPGYAPLLAFLQRRGPSQSLEELAAIVEVLEEDLRSGCASSHPPPSPRWSPLGIPGCSSEDMDEIVPSPESYRTCSPGGAVERQQVLQVCDAAGAGGQVWAEPLSPDWNLDSSCFFWTQLQKEEIMLGGLADAALLHTDGRGRTYVRVLSAPSS